MREENPNGENQSKSAQLYMHPLPPRIPRLWSPIPAYYFSKRRFFAYNTIKLKNEKMSPSVGNDSQIRMQDASLCQQWWKLEKRPLSQPMEDPPDLQKCIPYFFLQESTLTKKTIVYYHTLCFNEVGSQQMRELQWCTDIQVKRLVKLLQGTVFYSSRVCQASIVHLVKEQ